MSDVIEEAELARPPRDQPRPQGIAWRDHLTTMIALSAGGLLGASARYVVGTWATDRWGSDFPWATLLVNVLGSLVLGFYLTLVTERGGARAATRLFVATGFLGAYTAFSTFSYEVVQQIQSGEPLRASVYVVVTLVAGLLAVVIGIVAAQAIARPRSWLPLRRRAPR
ncbi:MAG: fluoride efflux transporter CrcB [Chloroflexota bacterium]|nr:fluoride efflux transporter CrcB [Chloroflexota bacterium]